MMASKLQINMIGPFEVKIDEQTADFRTDALRVLLAYLAAHQGTPLRRDTLAGLLSPDRPDKEALTYLRNRLTRLRSSVQDSAAVPPWFEIDRKQITLRMGEDVQIDTTRFDQLVHIVENHAHRQLAGCPTCLAHLQEAAELVRGELLTGLNFPSDTWESWLINQREHYQQRALDSLEWLREAREGLGEWTAVLDIAQRQLTMEPWLEAAHRAIMQAHYHLGDRNAALAQYEQCTAQLWEELGVEPEEATETLRQQILDDAVEAQEAFDIPNNLPTQTGAFFGRESEQQLLLSRLVDTNHRLITLVGAGGIGKTRLSQEAGAQVKTNFPDGVWFVPLHAIQGGSEQIKIAVGEAAGLSQSDKQLSGDQVIAILRDKQMLLIFDNCETVLDELAFLPEWLKRAPQIAILATSREPLNFQAESVVTLGGLPIGAQEAEALSTAEAMFGERAQMARDGFDITAENLADVRQICALVDGSPLGIALAAAWVRRRSLTQIIESIGKSLDFLATRMRDIDPRHKSMRAVFETSWQLLEGEDQEVLAALSVFPASFTAEAAETVAGATLFDLDVLCEKSLLQQDQESERYQMHSLVRQFSGGKLGGRAPECNQSFVSFYYRYASENRTDYGNLQPEWSNFSAGVNKANELEEWESVLDFVQVLDEPWFRQAHFDDMRVGLKTAVKAAIQLGNEERLAQSYLRLGEIEVELNDYETAENHLNAGLKKLMRLEDDLGIAKGKYLFGRIKVEQAKDDEAIKLFKSSKLLYSEANDLLGAAKNLNMIAFCKMGNKSDYQEAQSILEKSVSLQKSSPPSITYVEALRFLARMKSSFGKYHEAENHLAEALKISNQIHDIGEHVSVLYDQSLLCHSKNELEMGISYAMRGLELTAQLGSVRWTALLKTQLGLLHRSNEEYQQALPLFTEALLIFQELDDLYEQAYGNLDLYHLYKDLGHQEKSDFHKSEALKLNISLNDDGLAKKLG